MLIHHDVAPENYLAQEADYPLSNDGKMKEGVATLIHKKSAVTAAHCAVNLYKANFENHPFLVRIGGKENIVDWAVAPEQAGSVRTIRDHSGKLKKVKVKVRDESYDIALLRLKDEVEYISPVPLYQNEDGTLEKLKGRLLAVAEEKGMIDWKYGAKTRLFFPWERWR